ncbi:MAG: histidine phosphatase family protein [Deltaproteobacteria bacterium]|nr:histidine phosphatase family protein [Deltaproteobacteria bacterium]
MKRLALMRHAKSSWKDPALEDFDRPLNKRGRENAPLMGRRLARFGFQPQLILASPALRARQTAELVAAELSGSRREVVYEPRLYQQQPTTLLEVIKDIDEGIQDVLLIGHNPELTELVNFLSTRKFDQLATGGVACLIFQIESWQRIQPNSGDILFESYPKKPFPFP